MAWFNGGNWSGLSAQALDTIALQIGTAINERITAIGDPGAGYSPVPVLFAGASRIGSATIDEAFVAYQEKIEDILSDTSGGLRHFWGKSSVNETPHTKASLLASEGGNWLTWTRPSDSIAGWEQLRDALDDLTFLMYQYSYDAGISATLIQQNTHPSSEEIAWDNARGEAPQSVPISTIQALMLNTSLLANPGRWIATIKDGAIARFETAHIVGDLIETKLRINKHGDPLQIAGHGFTWGPSNEKSGTVTSSDLGLVLVVESFGTTIPVTRSGLTTRVDYDWDAIPPNSPFAGATGQEGGQQISVFANSAPDHTSYTELIVGTDLTYGTEP